MKTISIFILSLSITLIGFCQSQTNKIVLTKNQQLKFVQNITGNISQEMMGQSMETVMDITSNKSITVKDLTEQNYQLDATTTRLKMNMSMMGQDRNFDSNNKDDMAGDMKEAGKDINVVKPLSLTADGKCKAIENAETVKSKEDPMAGMMNQMLGGGADEIITESYFMLIPAGKKIGDTWLDSTITESVKIYMNYKWDSTQNNIAKISVTGKENNNSTVSAMGMDMAVSVTNDVSETRHVNLANGIVINKTSTKKINGTIEVMGQSVPMSGTVTTTTASE